jgi:hypothetical protein
MPRRLAFYLDPTAPGCFLNRSERIRAAAGALPKPGSGLRSRRTGASLFSIELVKPAADALVVLAKGGRCSVRPPASAVEPHRRPGQGDPAEGGVSDLLQQPL